ncbi:MAG TPA: DUF2934 domain-containing protein [Gammaproteobacteria bacterium]
MHKSKIQSSSDKPVPNVSAQARQAAAFGADPAQRQHMIAEAAYFLAEHHGFGGDPLQDWLTAEAEIDSWLMFDRPATSAEAAAYVRLRDEVRKAFSQMQDAIDAAALKKAFERGLAEAKRLEGFSAQVMHNAAVALRADMARASERMGPAWEQFSERSAGLFTVWKDRGRDFLGRSATAVRDWLHGEHRGPEH